MGDQHASRTKKTKATQQQPAAPSPRSLTHDHVHPLLHLQRAIGNQAVLRLLRSGRLQAQRALSQPSDQYEEDVDRIAAPVLRRPARGGGWPPGASNEAPINVVQGVTALSAAPDLGAAPEQQLGKSHGIDAGGGRGTAGPGGNGVPKKVMDHLKLREGWRTAVYLDSRGLPTVGLGHLLTAADKRTYKVGDHVPEDILNAWAQADAKKAYNAGQAQAATLGVSDQSFINALASVNFQLGIGWYTKHKKTWGYLATYEWEKAAREAQDSLWYKQTPVRVQDFQAALRALAGTTHTPTTAPPAAAGGGAEVVAAASGAEQMSRLLAVSRNSKRPQGGCYAAVKHYIIKAGGYGNILNPYTDKRLAKYQHYAHDFADAIRALGPATFGLQELSVSTPFEAPAGALVVVKPRSPGTSHPTAGDITVADGDGNFYNDGVMHYHGPKAWPPKAGGMLGCFMPQ